MEENTPFLEPIEHSMGRKFADMTRGERFVFVAQIVVCVATFGFAFPNVQKS